MANNWNYNDFQNWFCEKFKKPNPLPWQDAMGALIDYITNEIPDNIQVVLNKLTSGASSATLTGNGTPLEPFVLTINLSMIDFKGDTGPQGPRGLPGVGVTSVDQIELTSIYSMTYDTTNGWSIIYNAVIDYDDGNTHATTATARLPIKPGDNVTIDVSEDGKNLIIKATAGSSSGLHLYYLTDNGEIPLTEFVIPIVCDAAGITSPRDLLDKIYIDSDLNTLELPSMGSTGGDGYVIGMKMTQSDKNNGTFKVYTTRDSEITAESDKCSIKQVY